MLYVYILNDYSSQKKASEVKGRTLSSAYQVLSEPQLLKCCGISVSKLIQFHALIHLRKQDMLCSNLKTISDKFGVSLEWQNMIQLLCIGLQQICERISTPRGLDILSCMALNVWRAILVRIMIIRYISGHYSLCVLKNFVTQFIHLYLAWSLLSTFCNYCHVLTCVYVL